MDAYAKGLSRKQAAWASKNYRGHHVLPKTILDELEKANLDMVTLLISGIFQRTTIK